MSFSSASTSSPPTSPIIPQGAPTKTKPATPHISSASPPTFPSSSASASSSSSSNVSGSSPPPSPYTSLSSRLSWIERITRSKPDYSAQRDCAWAAEMDRLLALVDADTRDESPSAGCGPAYPFRR
ncbi:hypothetical protein CC85DRAFT_304903 [Cutaneotrichosporon oleaginosum]|uniref:Uncharacterized protein n=1 Tax=Cutaneotrichosporon oleaginosum TaxID=879819 RepID=A0A0J1AWD6_9TREE|nr:uncharacterized protein CC85DRAFT_304903 [Cutaneotrichosporon oleaginosum]KLT39599.1 hypothetical protein CC85DRAFT_304903 [Cutaneotrichosporon oleaginosum]TXT15473.1 hypothetical protein COLE_01666 [Cutaneotrichosporon oleaginosum]